MAIFYFINTLQYAVNALRVVSVEAVLPLLLFSLSQFTFCFFTSLPPFAQPCHWLPKILPYKTNLPLLMGNEFSVGALYCFECILPIL